MTTMHTAHGAWWMRTLKSHFVILLDLACSKCRVVRMKQGLFGVYWEEAINGTDCSRPSLLNALKGSSRKSELQGHSDTLLHAVCLQGEHAAKEVRGKWIWQENCFCPWRKYFCCSALLLRTAETVFRKSKICRHYQPHLDFTKPPKLGHMGARSLENDSLALYYLSEDFILLLSSPSSSPPSSLSSFSVILPLPFLSLSTPPTNVPPVPCCG